MLSISIYSLQDIEGDVGLDLSSLQCKDRNSSMRLVYRTQQVYLEERVFFRTYCKNLNFQDVRSICYVVGTASVDKSA